MHTGETSHMVQCDAQSKRQLIIRYKLNNPEMKACEIAQKVKTTTGYVYNVLSDHQNRVRSERWGSDRSDGSVSVHGPSFFEDVVLSEWCDELRAPVINVRTGMKQIGFKDGGDPCSCQIHRNGRVIIFPHALGWEEWLVQKFVEFGWDRYRAELVVENCRFTVKVIEAGVKVPEGYLPRSLCLKTAWGFMLVKDDSPAKNTLEVKLSVPNLEHYLGLPEIKKKLELLTQGSLTTNQLLRALATLLLRQTKGEKENV